MSRSVETELERPVLNPAFVAVSSGPNTLQIRAGPWSGRVMTIREDDEDEALAELFGKLDGEHTIDEILAPYDDEDREAILGLFGQLREKNVVYDAADWGGEVGRPQLQATQRFTGKTADRLEESSVLVASVGELGPQIAADLVRSGVGSVTLTSLADRETAEDPLGLLDRLADEDAFEVADGDGDVADALADVDAAMLATDEDRPEIAAAFNEFAHEAGTPWMLAQVRGFDGLVGPVVFPGETACYRCLERRIESNVSDPEAYAGYRDALADEPTMASVGLPSFARTVAGYATVDFLYLLAYGQAFTVGRTVVLDFLDLSTEINEVLKVPRCKVCGTSPGEDVKRFVTLDDLLDSELWTRHGGD